MNALAEMTQQRWNALSPIERDRLRDNSGLSPQLRGLEGWRVLVLDMHGETRKFIVGKSTGWRPCHLEILRRNSSGGFPADQEYRLVTKLERVR